MMQERGVEVDHSTINRWVLKYAPELDKRMRPGCVAKTGAVGGRVRTCSNSKFKF